MSTVKRLFYACAAIAGLIFALQILAESTAMLGPILETVLERVIRGDLSALGAGWISAMLLLNGASVMAIGLSFLVAGVITATEYFMVMAGSRLGAAFIVVFLGFLEYMRGQNESLRDATSIGVLSFLTTYLVYAPAIVIGYVLLQWFPLDTVSAAYNLPRVTIVELFNQLALVTLDVLGNAGAGFGMGVAALFVSLHIFDKAFTGVSADTFRSKYFRFILNNRWVSFAAGLAITAVTMSVAISLALLVPLHSKGYLKRDELIPYILGANVATMSGTILAAAILDTTTGMSIVLLFTAVIAAVTLVSMIFYDQFYTVLKWVFDQIMLDKNKFFLFILSLGVIPLLLILG